MKNSKNPVSNEDRRLGMEGGIIRRDFLNSTLLGLGAALLDAPAPAFAEQAGQTSKAAADAWTGYGGVGDYATSNGNTWAVMNAGHQFRDGNFAAALAKASDTGEMFDVIIVGGGLSGLGAAYYFTKGSGGQKRALVLENHPIFGGACKQNEFMVNGQRLIGPQGSNDFSVPRAGSNTPIDQLFTDLKLPREFQYEDWDASLQPLRFARDNYSHMDGINDTQVDVGYYFDHQSGAAKPAWLRNIFNTNLEGTPFPDNVKRDLIKWRNSAGGSQEFRKHLDTITYSDYLEREAGFSPAVTKFVEPVIGLISGLSCDAVSARVGHELLIPVSSRPGISFPGGNTTFARHIVKALVPGSMNGDSFEAILNGSVDFAALDRLDQATRIRLGATVLRVEPDSAGVAVTYEKGGKLYRSKARAAVMASAGWMTKHVVTDLPANIRAAYDEFQHASAMSVNVALTNWRFLYKLGAPACRWFSGGFGFSANIRRSMVAGSYQPPLHPDKPVVLTFYTGLYTPGKSPAEQGALGRKKLMETSYRDYERQIRSQMTTMFGGAGFDPVKDIAGIVLNRWGHARIVQPPGFYYGRDGKPAAREIVAKGFGRVAIGHSELDGHQTATGAILQGKRTAESVLGMG